MKKLPIILVCGGSCSGKTVFANFFNHAFVLSMDHFYFGKKQMKKEKDGSYNFDAPTSVDIKGCAKAVESLSRGDKTTIPIYDMRVSDRTGTQTLTVPKDTKFLVVEGIFSFYSPLREIGDMNIYLDIPPEIRVARRMIRDVEKGRSDIDTLSWSITVEKNHREYIEPMKKYADLIIPFSYNPVAFPH
jgi:uridine kinase